MGRLGSVFPTYFTFVMATGILCVAAQRLGHHTLAWVLLGCNLPVYWLVWAGGLVRLLASPAGLWRELGHHATGPVFLTSIAGSAILGSDVIAMGLPVRFAEVLFGIAIVAWVVLTYSFLASVTEGREKPPLETGLNGGWLLVVVSIGSLAVLGCDILNAAGVSPFLAFACSGESGERIQRETRLVRKSSSHPAVLRLSRRDALPGASLIRFCAMCLMVQKLAGA